MTASSGKKRHKSTGFSVISVFLLFNFVPFCQTFSLPIEKLILNIPHTAEIGYTVLKTDLDETCLEVDHIQRSVSRQPSNPFTVSKDGRLVTKSSLLELLGELFVIRPIFSKSCQSTSSVSLINPVYVEVVHTDKTLHFAQVQYTGSIQENAPFGTKIKEIQNLYACSSARCRNNLDYRIVGSNDFYLETVAKDGHIQLEIYNRNHLKSRNYNFMIVAQNTDDLQGHTSIEVKVNPVSFQISLIADVKLFFSPRAIHRHKRETEETLNTQVVEETNTGFLFSVKDPNNNNWKYSLSSSTYQNAFAVSETGDVSVAPGFTLDYEALTAAPGGSSTVELTINVLQKTDETLVKILKQPVTITDVNDEAPVFTNRPTPFLAAVSVNAPAYTLVYILTAQDSDAGASNTLEVSPATDPNVRNYFLAQIQRNSVAIYWIGNQAFTENQEFRMTFIATDTAAPVGTTQRTTAHVLILAGTRPPQFMENSYSIEFEEKNALKQVIATVEVYSFQQNSVTFTVLDENLQSSAVFGTQPIASPTGPVKGCHIIVNKIMDYETPPRTFNVKIRATEDSTGLYTDQEAVINVTDNNEFKPRFTSSTYKKENQREDIAVGTALLTVTASDEDYNTNLRFSVDDDHFRVEANNPSSTQMSQTATIFVDKKLDYDRISLKNYEFNAMAADDGEISKTGKSIVQIFMSNINDEAPVFPDPMVGEVRYDAAIDSQVYIVRATDADQGDIISYAFVQSNALFQLDAATGRITLRQVIPLNTERYELQIRATDDGGCCGETKQLTSTGTVTVNILTDNLNRPEFRDCIKYQPEVSEEQVDAFVLQVVATDDDIGSNGRVTYSIRESYSKFRINSTSGQLYTAEKIDRENLGVSKTVPVNVIATDGGNLQGTCSLLVKITDINDNAPRFVTQIYNFPVEDTSPPDSVAALVEATDADSGPNGEVIYSFTPGGNPGGYFRFDDLSYTGQIKVNRTLQQDETITLNVKATDKGVPPLSSNVFVIITVTSDATKLPPVWSTSGVYSVTVNESIDSSLNILTFSAQSRIDTNVKLLFKVVDQNSIFRTVPVLSTDRDQTGHLRLRPGLLLDYETTESYSLNLRASDVNNIYSDQRVTITVTDTNDNIPFFLGTNPDTGFLDMFLLEGNYTTVGGQGKEVGRIRARDDDRDSPNNVIVNYRIVEANSRFTLDSTTGLLYTKHEFDRENPNFIFTITVEAVDGAPSAFPDFNQQPNTGAVTVKLTLEDVNDNPPSFPQQSYTFEAPEDLPIGDRLPNNVKVTAIDPDSAAVLTYFVSPLPASNLPPPFSIQPQTGHLTVAGALDFYKGPAFQHYEFIVNVFDSIHSSSTTVTINVKNVNDNSPVVGNYRFEDFVEENVNDIGPIATVNASDVDGDIDGDGFVRFWYELKFTNTKDQQYFAIDQQTGVLSIVKRLDRDLPNGNAEFIFTVEVADKDPNDPTKTPRFGFGEVIVRPIDINDNAPMFPEEGRQMTVMENQVAGTLVDRVSVIDYDEGINAEFDLAILRQSPEVVFTLDGLDLKTTASLDREKIDKYFVVMQAVDKGPGTNTGTGTLTITVLDENDNAPYFNRTYSFQLSEHQTSGEFGRIKAYDLDIGPNAVLTYTLASKDTTYFTMDKDEAQNEGILTVYQVVDYDDMLYMQRNFNLTAYAIDPDPGPNNEKRAQTYIKVIVTDYNDEVPTFEQREKTVDIAENAAVGTVLETFNATDRDVDPNYKAFEYYISCESDPTRRFTLNEGGQVSILNPLDRETVAQHIVHILAIDNVQGSPQNTGTATLTVKVIEINDNCQDCVRDYSKTTSIMENKDCKSNEVVTISTPVAKGQSTMFGNSHLIIWIQAIFVMKQLL